MLIRGRHPPTGQTTRRQRVEDVDARQSVCDLLIGSTAQDCQRLCEGATQHLQQQDINAMYEQVAERERKEQGKT
jgi:hypothetical protein